jgi:GNAT superfamily N-acetyltransferase
VVLVEDATGQIVASMTLLLNDGVTWEAFGYVHPEHQGNGLGAWVIEWSEVMANQRVEEWRPDYRVTMLNYTSTINEAAHALLGEKQYDIAKVFRRMRIDLSERPAAVIWPDGFSSPSYDQERDQHSYFEAIQEAFAEHWSASPRTFEHWSKSWQAEGYDPELLVKLMHGERIVGACCGKPVGDGGWIGYVAVILSYRRRGLAKLLLQESFGRFWDKGITQIDLGVDSENRQSAIDLYLGMGMQESHSYETNRKVLRDGLDWREDED